MTKGGYMSSSLKFLVAGSFFLIMFSLPANFNKVLGLHESWGNRGGYNEQAAWGGNGGWWGGGNREWVGDYDGPGYHSHYGYHYPRHPHHYYAYPYDNYYYNNSYYDPYNQYYYDDSVPGAGLYINFR